MENITQKVTDKIFNVGAFDYDLDLFESQYKISDGVSYNSYVIIDEKTAIVDTIDIRKTDEWLNNLDSILCGRSVDYLIVSHMEPDHSANVKTLMDRYPDMQVIGNTKTFAMISQFFNMSMEGRAITVKEGDSICLGKHVLNFVMAPMIHWPEVMVTYESTEKILFSADAFGKFGNAANNEDWETEAARYYFNIVGKYGVQVQALLKKAANLDIATICPLHGPVLTENLSYYIEKYNLWSSYTPDKDGIMIAYASVYGNTAAAARKLKDMLESKGVSNVLAIDLSRHDLATAVSEAFRYGRLVLASATYDAGIFPSMEAFLAHLKGHSFQNRTIGLMENGSWAPMAAKIMRNALDEMKNISVCEPVITIKSAMNQKNIEDMEQLASCLIQ